MVKPLEALPTKIAYAEGRPTELTLRHCSLQYTRGGRTAQHTFQTDRLTIGTAEDNDLQLDDETVSRNHCEIFLEGTTFLVRDLGSTNGTFIDRVRVREAFLKPDCTVLLGTSELRFMPIEERVRIRPSTRERMGDMVGADTKMREIYAILEKIAPTDSTIVVEGETGTGKEVVARTIHSESRRKNGAFMVFDCGAVPANLIESELFGHEKGAFTGAMTTRQGVFELASGGTVFLDELGELALELQPKLLRVLEQREIKRVGGTKPIKVDVRVVAATNRNLETEVAAGRFREDLYYRLSVVRLMLPALRDRKTDIRALVDHFLDTGAINRDRNGERQVTRLSDQALNALVAYRWPGNVRELNNVIERALMFTESDTIDVGDLPDHVLKLVDRPAAARDTSVEHVNPPSAPGGLAFKDAKEQWVSSFERDYIAQLLERNGENISHAAREADIDRKYFRKLMKKYGLGNYDADAEPAE